MNILVLDDDRIVRETLKSILSSTHTVHLAATFDDAVEVADKHDIDLAIVDLDLRDSSHDGIEFLKFFKDRFPGQPLIIESSNKDIQTVVKCMKLGADDYIEKPIDAEVTRMRIDKVIADSKKSRTLQRAMEKTARTHEIIGNHESILRAKEAIEKAGRMRILITGEVGVGKTPFAWYSNQLLSRLDGGQPRPFEHLNCAALNKEYFQDQMFGHKKGAFTNAISDKRGLVEIAKGGDLFLDEIGEMPLDVQALFLTFLDNMEYYRLGDDQKRIADVRIICATNQDLEKLEKEGKFRKDFRSRFSRVEVRVPPLRDRISDIPLLFEHFVNQFAGFSKPSAPELLPLLQKFRWEEGNVREFRDTVQYLCETSQHAERIEVTNLPNDYRPLDDSQIPLHTPQTVPTDLIETITQYGLDPYMGHFEKKILQAVINGTDTLEAAAKRLRISKTTLWRRMKKYNVPLDGREP